MRMQREKLEKYLEEKEPARERVNKDRAIVNVLVTDPSYFPILEALKNKVFDAPTLTRFVQDHNSMDRMWRKILEERPELRGTDYEKKDELEKEVQKELGYKVKP